ncbi:MAG TPA: hypothetical protein VKC15_11805 [Gemmatimonadales bacterium]|nr:hypothetical protein [Gemmatimonadales bacterium]
MAGDLIGREALDRIIKRAAELQAGAQDVGDGLTQDEVVALGKDVGIPSRYLQQAMLEERTRAVVETRRGFWPWLTGPRTLSADRVVPGDRPTVERALTRWMEEEESLQVKRRFADRTSWEPKAGAFATIQRALGGKGRRFSLANAQEVTGQVTQLEAGFCHVGMTADIRPSRSRRLQGGTVLFTVAALATTALAVTLGVVAVVPAVVLIPTAGLVARRHRVENERVLVAMEQVLDRLERGEIRAEHALPGMPQNPFERIADQVRKAFGAP